MTYTYLLLGVLALLVILSGLNAVPVLVFIRNPESMQYSFEDPIAAQDRVAKSTLLQDWIRRVQELGFQSIGIKVEKLPMWGEACREVALVSREAETYASIVLQRNADPMGIYFYTPFQGGGMVFTRDHLYAPETEGDRLSVKNIASKDFREIFENHKQRLHFYKDKGLQPLVGSGEQARMEATGAFYASDYSRRLGRYFQAPQVLGFVVFLLLMLAAVGWYVMTPR